MSVPRSGSHAARPRRSRGCLPWWCLRWWCLDQWRRILPWKRAERSQAKLEKGRANTVENVVLVRYAQRGTAPGGKVGDAGPSDREAEILELQDELTRLCREASPLMQRLHLFLSAVEAQCQIRIHRGTLPLTNDEFEQLLRAIRATDDPEVADEALAMRKSLIDAGHLTVPPRPRRPRRR